MQLPSYVRLSNANATAGFRTPAYIGRHWEAATKKRSSRFTQLRMPTFRLFAARIQRATAAIQERADGKWDSEFAFPRAYGAIRPLSGCATAAQ